MFFHAVASSLSGFFSLLLGITVFFKASRTNNEVKVFVWLCVVMFIWLFNYGLMEAESDPSRPLFFAKLGHSAVIFSPTLYMHFTRYLLKAKQLVPIYQLYYLFDIVLLVLLWTTPSFIPAITRQPWGLYPVGGITMLVEALVLALDAAICWTIFFIGCRKLKISGPYQEYNRVTYCCIALIGYSLGALDYLPKFGVHYYPLAFLTNTFFVSLVTYAVLVHRLLDINVVFRKSLVHSMLIAFITATYFVIGLLVERGLQEVVGYRSIVGTVIAAFIIALGFTPVRDAIQRWVDRVFFGGSQIVLAEENERLRREIEQSEKLKAVSTLAAGMAHEIKNPLASIKTFTEYLPQKYEDPAFREKFTRIVTQEVEKINALVVHLLDFAKPAPPKKQPVHMAHLLDETIDFLQGKLVAKHLTVDRRYRHDSEVLVDPAQMTQVFLNVLLNSVDGMDGPGTITIDSHANNGHVEVAIRDSGIGIEPKHLDRVFDPFFTTKSTGTGLGLSVVHGIISEHRGRIRMESAPGDGTTLRIALPIYRKQSADNSGGRNGQQAANPHCG